MKFSSKISADRNKDPEYPRPSFMGRLFKFLFVLVFLLVVGYCGWWYLTANKMEEAIREKLKSNGEVKFSSLQKTGFPVKMGIDIIDLTVDVKNQTVVGAKGFTNKPNFSLSFQGPIRISSEIFGKSAYLSLPNPIKFKVSENEFQWTAQSPVNFTLTSSDIMGKYFFKGFENLDNAIEKMMLSAWELKTNIPEGTAVSGDKEMYKSGTGKLFVKYNYENPQKSKIDFMFEGLGNEYLPGYYEYMQKGFENISTQMGSNPQVKAAVAEFVNGMIERSKKTQKTSVRLDFSYNGPFKNDTLNSATPSDFQLKINQIALVNKLFAINMDSDLSMQGNADPMPNGWFRVSITNYKVWLDYFFDWMSSYGKLEAANRTALGTGALPSIFNETTKNNILIILEKFGKKTNDSDLQIIVRKDSGSAFLVGDTPFEEVMKEIMPLMSNIAAPPPNNQVPGFSNSREQ